MTDDDHTDDSERAVTRRAAMGGGAGALAAMVGLSTGTASAQTTGTEPRIQLGDDWEIDDVDRGDGTTDLLLRHIPSGSEFVFDGDSETATVPGLVTDEVGGGVTGGNTVTNLIGDGLEYASGAVQVLSSIWDSANQVITADVDNSSVVTESVSTGSATVDGGKEVPGINSSSSAGDLSFGDWEQASANRPAEVYMEGFAITDGSTTAFIDVEIDESGGTSADYDLSLVKAHNTLGSGTVIENTLSIQLPPGAQYRVINAADPNNSNAFAVERIFVQ